MMKDKLLSAIAALEKMERAGKACLDHPKTCWLCRSRFLGLLCSKWEHLMSEFAKAEVDVESYRVELKADETPKTLEVPEVPDVTPTAEWLEKLYKL